MVDNMTESWTTSRVAGALMEVLPLLGRTMHRHAHAVDEERTTLGQVRTLFFLIEYPMTVSILAKKRHVSMQAASALVQGLVERGWVVRVPDPNDRRQSLLKVTPEGLEQAQFAKGLMVTHLAATLDGLQPDELDAAGVFLDGLKRVLSQKLPAEDPFDDLPDD